MFDFVIGGNGSPLVKITITDNGDGSFTFTLEQIGSGADGAWQAGDLKGELRGLFFDVDGNVALTSANMVDISLDDGRQSYSGDLAYAVTTGGSGEDDVTGFNTKTFKSFSDVNMNGEGLPDDGGYDVGVAFGTSGTGTKGDDVQGLTFTLSGFEGFALDDFALQDFGVRMMSVGTVDADGNIVGERTDSAKIVGSSPELDANVAPEATETTADGNEDTTIAVTLSGTDSDGTIASVTLKSLPIDGLLYTDATLTTLAVIETPYAGDSVTFYFAPDANFNGSVSFEFTVTDDDGASDDTPATATIDVTPVNDAPEGADNTVTTNEDEAYVFTAADFGFSDPNDSPADGLLSVIVASLPAAGTLLLDGAAVSANQEIAVADIDDGKLSFEPAENENGAGYASFTFQVRDDGGTANGGADTDPSANTVTIDVTPVNDAPVANDDNVFTNTDPVSIPEWALLFNDTDVEDDALDVTDLGGAAGATSVTHTAGGAGTGSVSFDDDGTLGGSFTYKASDGTDAGNAATVLVSRTTGDTITGGAGNDILISRNSAGSVLVGAAGADLLLGGTSNDTYHFAFTGDGADIIRDAAGGNDLIRLGTTSASSVFTELNFERVGDDLVLKYNGSLISVLDHFAGTDNAVENVQFSNGGMFLGYSLGTTSYRIGTDASSPLDGTGQLDVIAASNGTEELNGGNNNDLLFGNAANDTINGGNGNDLLVGGAGDDSLNGGGDNDWLFGGEGIDTANLSGGGVDRVIYTNVLDAGDILIGFDKSGGGGQDFIDLDLLFDGLGVASGDRAGRVAFVDVGSDVELRLNAETSSPDFEVTLLTFQGMADTSGLTAGTGALDDVQVGTMI